MAASRKIKLIHRIEYAVYLRVEAFLKKLSIFHVVWLGRMLAGIFYALFPSYRRLVERNMRILLARNPFTEKELQQKVRETFLRTGANLLASLRTAHMSREELENALEIQGEEVLWQALEKKKGVVLICAHMGNWEMLAQMLDLYQGRLQGGSMYRSMKNPLMEALIYQRRSQRGGLMFSRQQGYVGALKALRENAVIAVLSDQRAGMGGEAASFFGKISSCAPLPSLMARRVGAEMISLSISSLELGRWRIQMRAVTEKSCTQEVISALELAISDQLEDGFWFQDRWRCEPQNPFQVTRDHPSTYPPTTALPLRILLAPPTDNDAAKALINGIFELRPDAEISLLVRNPQTLEQFQHLPRVIPTLWDDNAPPESFGSLIQRIDHSHPIPLDFAILCENGTILARACTQIHLHCIIGIAHHLKNKSPFTSIFTPPQTTQEWQNFPQHLAFGRTHSSKKNSTPPPQETTSIHG